MLHKLRRLTGPFFLRRRKSDKAIELQLPEKLVEELLVELPPNQQSMYDAVGVVGRGAMSRELCVG